MNSRFTHIQNCLTSCESFLLVSPCSSASDLLNSGVVGTVETEISVRPWVAEFRYPSLGKQKRDYAEGYDSVQSNS